MRRLLALAVIYDGGHGATAAAIGGVGLADPSRLGAAVQRQGAGRAGEGKAPGRAACSITSNAPRLAPMVEAGPIPAIHGVVRWRLIDLAQWVWEEYPAYRSPSRPSAGNCARWAIRKLSARPRHHAQTRKPWRRLKKLPRLSGGYRGAHPRQADRALVPGRSPHRPEEQDHAPLGPRGTRPLPRTTSAPPRPISSAPSAPREAKAPASSCHFATPRRWTCIWRRSRMPSSLAPTPCPARSSRMARLGQAERARQHHACPATAQSPELNPVENIWQYHARQLALEPRLQLLRRHRRSLLRRLEQARRSPWHIMSIGLRDWAHRS